MIYKLVLTVLGVWLFALIDNAAGRVIVASCICGAATFLVSEILAVNYGNGFMIYFISACVTCGMSEIGARIMCVPVTVILLPAIIPLVPGALLYSTMKALLQGEGEWYYEYGKEAIVAAAGIGVAIVSISLVSKAFYGFKKKILKK